MTNDINGSWINIHTGEAITVINNVIDENGNMVIISNKGELSFNEFSNNYVKNDEDTDSISNENILPVDDEMLIDDIPIQYHEEQSKPVNTNDNLLKNIFDKIESKPQININVEWNDFPINDIKTLIKYVNIDINDISDYIVKNYVNHDKLISEIEKIINK